MTKRKGRRRGVVLNGKRNQGLPEPTQDRGKRWLFALFVLVCLLNAWPFVVWRTIPFCDHPSHLLKANIIRHFSDTELRYFENFVINRTPVPNVLTDYVVAGLGLALPLETASKIVLGLIVFALPLSVWFWISRVAPGREVWASLAWPMAWNQFLRYGNENFCASVVLLFFFFGLLASWDGGLRGYRLPLLAGLATLIYLGHFLVFLMAGLAVLLHASVRGARFPRTWLSHAAICLFGLMLAVVWVACGTGNSLASVQGDISLASRVQAAAQGIFPYPWDLTAEKEWRLALAVGTLGIVVCSAVLRLRRDGRFPSLLTLALCVPALFLPRWFIIYAPDERLWWVATLTSFSLLPKLGRRGRLVTFSAALLLASVTQVWNGQMLSVESRSAEAIRGIVEKFPKGLRLAYLTHRNMPTTVHRCFEYYHIRSGGLSPHHLIGPEQSVKYRAGPPPTPDIYAFNADVVGKWLDNYDGVLVFANQDMSGTSEVVEALRAAGYKQRSPLACALFLHPEYVRTNSPVPAE